MIKEDIKNLKVEVTLTNYFKLMSFMDEDDLDMLIEGLEDHYNKDLSKISDSEIKDAIYDFLYDNYDPMKDENMFDTEYIIY